MAASRPSAKLRPWLLQQRLPSAFAVGQVSALSTVIGVGHRRRPYVSFGVGVGFGVGVVVAIASASCLLPTVFYVTLHNHSNHLISWSKVDFRIESTFGHLIR